MGPQTEAAEALDAMKHRLPGETFRDAVNRQAKGLCDDDKHYHDLREVLGDMRFLPAGRIRSGVGSGRGVTLGNCFVSGVIEDSYLDGDGCIMQRLAEAARTLRMGGGIGYDFSTLRPRGSQIRGLGSHSTGPVSFMSLFNAIGDCTSSTGERRGAQMAIMRIDHPDVVEFVNAKHDNHSLRRFNMSVGVTDEFMGALAAGRSFPLRFAGRVHREVDARELWETIMRSTWDWAEPGVFYVDQANRMNNLWYCETLIATNPCFAADTLIRTAEGDLPITSLVEREVTIWDGRAWRRVDNFRITGRDQPMLRIETQSGAVIRVTPAHTMILRDDEFPYMHSRVPASHVRPGDVLWTDHATLFPMSRDVLGGTVVKVDEDGVDAVVYCCTVDGTHSVGLGNGIVTGNCGEAPLPAYGQCCLGSFNLARYMRRRPVPVDAQRDSPAAWYFDHDLLEADVPVVVRAMDNVFDRSGYPLPQQQAEAVSKRRLGLGVMALANAVEAMGMPYGSDAALVWHADLKARLLRACYRASVDLAIAKGSFPLFDAERFVAGGFMKSGALDDDTVELVRRYGIRNSHLMSTAPTGTISMVADNVSSGIEPVFAYRVSRAIETPDGPKVAVLEDYGARVFGVHGRRADDVPVAAHLRVLAVEQRFTDQAVSKTCNTDGSAPWDDFKAIYTDAYAAGVKGITTFNRDGKRFALLKEAEPAAREEPAGEGESCRLDPETGRRDCA